jgi:YidC/Oxa1 family membrane protein insertase
MDLWNAFVVFLEQVLLTFYAWWQNLGLPGASGAAVILFTIVARFVILPLTVRSLQSSRRLQEIQPLMKELQRKHGKDPQKLQEETFKLYREYKVNPAGGCLPLLLQLPIFLGVYQAVINLTRVSPAEYAGAAMLRTLGERGVEVANLPATFGQPQLAGSFLWLPDLGKTDPLFILPVASIVFQLLVQLMATPRVQDPQQKAMMQSMLIMPIIFGYIGFTFPSGAVLYWVVGSILSMIQQYVISGWGSLANYLKFLPADTGLLKPIMPVAAAAGAGDVADADVPQQKTDFWDVLRPLMDQKVEVTEPPLPAQTTEQVMAEARRQITGNGQNTPRRRRPRR